MILLLLFNKIRCPLGTSFILLVLILSGCVHEPLQPPTVDPDWSGTEKTESQTGTNLRFEPVHVRTEFGEAGNGARFKTRDGCVTFTAEHVVRNTNHPIITPLKSAINDAVVETSDEKMDVALVKQLHEHIEECPALPSREDIIRAIRNATQREIWYVDSGGNGTLIKVDLVGLSDADLKLALVPSSHSPRVFQPGMSGSVVIFDGTPVGILKNVNTGENGVAHATRFDAVTSKFQQYLPQPLLIKTQTQKKSAPYDIDQLPAFYQQIVKKARETKEKVLRVMKLAEETKIKAEDAAAKAKTLPKSQPSHNYANYNTFTNDDYAGEVYLVGYQIYSNGYGVLTMGSSQTYKNTYYCKFKRNQGCEGVGVIQFAENPSNSNGLDVWMGGLKGVDRYGLGYLKWFQLKDKQRPTEAWFFLGLDDKESRPGVWQENNGFLFEGEIGTNSWEGWGVLWDKNGQVLYLGRWKNGKFVEDQTKAWRSGALLSPNGEK